VVSFNTVQEKTFLNYSAIFRHSLHFMLHVIISAQFAKYFKTFSKGLTVPVTKTLLLFLITDAYVDFEVAQKGAKICC